MDDLPTSQQTPVTTREGDFRKEVLKREDSLGKHSQFSQDDNTSEADIHSQQTKLSSSSRESGVTYPRDTRESKKDKPADKGGRTESRTRELTARYPVETMKDQKETDSRILPDSLKSRPSDYKIKTPSSTQGATG